MAGIRRVKAVVIPDDETQAVEVRYIIVPSFEDGYRLIGTDMIQMVLQDPSTPRSVGRWTGWCDEDGKVKNRPVNRRANGLAAIVGWAGYPDDFLVGPVIFFGQTPNGRGYADVPELLETVCVEMGAEVHWYDGNDREVAHERG